MALDPKIQGKILELYLEGKTPYAISEELKINFRTAQKYAEKIDDLLNKIKLSVAYCILEKIKETPDFLQD